MKDAANQSPTSEQIIAALERASCRLGHGLPLATFNTKDFADYVEHDGLCLIETEFQ